MEQAVPAAKIRPFPGLRSFTREEPHLFFGREGQSDEILRRFDRFGFVAVVGTSGCGKSSLVRAGLLPALLAGYAIDAGSSWQIADLHPGGDPLGSLARALNRSGATAALDAATLRSASAAVVEAVAQARQEGRLAADANVLLLVDQFEELFRYTVRPESATADRDEKARFVALLLEAARVRAQRIFVVLTLRAEFLGDCAQFRDLPEAINRGQYLVPRMTRIERRAAIEGPVHVAGAEIAPHLVQRLLNDLGEDPDQLPVLQNALLRIWGAWAESGKPEREIEFEHYKAVGTTPEGNTTLKAALDRHANEALDEVKKRLGPAAESLVKGMFLRLRDRDDRGRETRTPASVKDLCDVIGADLDAVRTAVDCFRDDAAGRTFLTPFKSQVAKVDENDEIDITHESLLRCWTELKDRWVPEEEESKRIYVTLARRAEEDPARQNLLRGSLFERVSEWWQKRRPNAAWAARYHSGFEAAKKYLLDSASAEAEIAKAQADSAIAEARRKTEIAEAHAKVEKAQLTRKYAYWIAALSIGGLVLALYSFLSVRSARGETVAYLLASRAALASGEDGAGLETGLLLAAESLRRLPTSEAQVVADRALFMLPPPLAPPPNSGARQVALGAWGNVLGVVDRGGTLSLWATTGQTPRAPAGSLTGISSFAFARQGAILVGAQESGSVVVWNAAEGQRMAQFDCPGKKQVVAINATGAVVAALCAGHLHVWKADPSWDRAKTISVPALEGVWTQLALADKGEAVALGRNTDREEFDVPSYIALIHLGLEDSPKAFGLDERIQAMVFLSALKESSLALGSESGKVWIQPLPQTSTDLQSRAAEVQTLFRRSTAVTALSLNEDGSRLIAGYRDGIARIWDRSQGAEVARLVGDGPAISVALSDEAGQAFSVGRNLQAWNLARLNDSVSLKGVSTARFYTDPPLLLYSRGRRYAFLDIRTRTELGHWNAADGSYPVAITQGGARVAVRLKMSEPDFSLGVCDFSSHQIGAPLWRNPVPGSMGHPAFSRDGKHLAAFVFSPFAKRESDRLGLFVWNAATGAEEVYRPELSLSPSRFGFTPDSRRILFAPEKGRLKSRLLGSQEEEELQIVPERGITALAFSPDGAFLATAASGIETPTADEGESGAARIRLRHYPSGRELSSFEQAGSIRTLVFSQDSRYLLSSGSDRSVVVWNTQTAQEEARFVTPSTAMAVTFTPDGGVALVDRRQVVFHRWRPEDLIREACRRTRRNLTLEEWKRYVPGEGYSQTCPTLP